MIGCGQYEQLKQKLLRFASSIVVSFIGLLVLLVRLRPPKFSSTHIG